jgi:hypothetical protein
MKLVLRFALALCVPVLAPAAELESVAAEKDYLACKTPFEAATARRRISEMPNRAHEISLDELNNRGCVVIQAGAQLITDGVNDVRGDTFTRVHLPGEAEEYWVVGPYAVK